MKALLFSILILSTIPAVADSYTGVVSGVKHFSGGAVAVDLDGKYPHEKMALYVPAIDAAAVGALPTEGAKVTATGDVVPYKGKPEIKITTKSQWSW
jgi:hypothetical protein